MTEMIVAEDCPVLPVGAISRACGPDWPPWRVRRLLDRGIKGVRVFKFGPARMIDRRDLHKVLAAVKATDNPKNRRDAGAVAG